MIYAQPGQARTAILEAAPPGIAADLLFSIVGPPGSGIVYIAPTAAGIVEDLNPGGASSDYGRPFDAPLSGGDYRIRWARASDPTILIPGEDLEVGWNTPAALTPPTGDTYATPDALRARLRVDAATLSDDDAANLISDAEDRVDRIAGTWPIRPDNGRKFNPAGLTTLYATALQDATTILAAAAYRNPDAFRLTDVDGKTGMVRGPDFELRSPTPLPAEGRAAFRDAAAKLEAMGLRTLTARMRP